MPFLPTCPSVRSKVIFCYFDLNIPKCALIVNRCADIVCHREIETGLFQLTLKISMLPFVYSLFNFRLQGTPSLLWFCMLVKKNSRCVWRTHAGQERNSRNALVPVSAFLEGKRSFKIKKNVPSDATCTYTNTHFSTHTLTHTSWQPTQQ